MKGTDQLQLAQIVAAWFQTAAIVFGGIWVLLYTFVYSDLYKSSQIPIHINSEMELSTYPPSNGYIQIKARIELRNDSSRDVYLMPALFLALGSNVTRRPEYLNECDWSRTEVNKASAFWMEIEEAFNDSKLEGYVSRYYKRPDSKIVYGAGLLKDYKLSPRETVSRTLMFEVPDGMYTDIEAKVEVWGHNGKKSLSADLKFNSELKYLYTPCIKSDDAQGSCVPIDLGKMQKSYDIWEFVSKDSIPLPNSR